MDNKSNLQQMLSALEVFRAAGDQELQLHFLIVFLYIALHDGCLQQTLIKVTGNSEASISRVLAKLGDVDRHGNPGLKLIRRDQDPADYKRCRVFMTPKGERLAFLLSSQLEA
jgi:DNA-binding MarR family transcriptional regulator